MAIDKKKTFINLYNSADLKSSATLESFFELGDSIVRRGNRIVTTGALNNTHGDWYEWLIAILGIEMKRRHNLGTLLLPLPNVAQFDFYNLYNENIVREVVKIRQMVSQSTVSLVTSNPDFVLIKGPSEIVDPSASINLDKISEDSLEKIDSLYKPFIHKLDIVNLPGYLSVKSSLRPDRRLQIAHEGSLIKAIHARLTQQLGGPNGNIVKYYALTTKVGPQDKNALNTVATHSIASKDFVPIKAVDGLFGAKTIRELKNAILEILST